MDVDLRQDEDQDSLFGSPPPSPQITGRPESPSLALPCSGVSGSRSSTSTAPATQNVGTIALPGSHPDSELAINPLALSLSHGVVHRPPAVPQRPSTSMLTAHRSSVPPTRSSSRRAASSLEPRPKAKKKSRQSSRSSTSEPMQPQGPEFILPDPSAPPPVNFLRNQENLLGRAGLVGGVKPAALTHTTPTPQPYMPGSTPSNPILVDEEDDTPILGRRSRSKEQPYIDPALLTAPTNQEIVSVLIGQKDIFPILEGVLKLVMRSATGETATTGSNRLSSPKSNNTRSKSSASGQTVKKRKLNRVPAGATDWDVPYPFPEGEGPDAYRKTWERERGKQLISQLIKLIKTAARKAATKKYLQQRAEEEIEGQARVNEHYRPETASYGSTTDQTVLQDASNGSRKSRSVDTSPTASNFPPTEIQTVDNAQSSAMPTFDELNASIDAVAPDQGSSGGSTTQPGFNNLSASRQNLMFSTPTEAPSFGADQPMFDTWMNFLEQFPMSFGGSSDNLAALSSEPVSHSSTPGLDEFNLVSMMGGNSNSDPNIASSEFDAMMSSMLGQPHMPGNDASMMDNNAVFPAFDNSGLEENIFASTSGPVGGIVGGISGVIDPSLQIASPIASPSSVGSNDPVTPVATDWDLTMPDVTIGGVESNAEGQGWDAGNDVGLQSLSDFGVLPEVPEEIPDAAPLVDKGKGRAVEPPANASRLLLAEPPLPTPQPASPSQFIFQAMLDPKLRTCIPPPPAPATSRKLRKDEILQRAREKRRLIQEELDKVKMQLWETTIEQASLVQLVKQLDDVERSENVVGS